MNEEQVNDLLNKQKNAEVVNIFEYRENQYIKAFKLDEKKLIYVYYKLDENQNISEIEDKELLKEFKRTQEIHEKRIY